MEVKNEICSVEVIKENFASEQLGNANWLLK